MTDTQAKILALLLEQDSFFTDFGIQSDFEKSFGTLRDEDEFQKVLSELKSNDTMIAFDVEDDGLDGVYIEHEKFGEMRLEDCELSGTDRFYSIGPAFPVALHKNLNLVSEAAIEGGLKEALRSLSMLPIDSASWTGIPRGFRFTPEAQAKLVATLGVARGKLQALELSNADAAKAVAYLDCALMLAELPDPEPDVIFVLIQRLLAVVGTVGFFADLKGLFS